MLGTKMEKYIIRELRIIHVIYIIDYHPAETIALLLLEVGKEKTMCDHVDFTESGPLSFICWVLLDAPSTIAGAPSISLEWAKMSFI